MCEVVRPDVSGTHEPGVPDDPSLWGSSIFQIEKSGFHPSNSEDPSCVIIDSAVDERPVADDSLIVVMEADFATGTTRPGAQIHQFLTDKLCAWKCVHVDRVACEREALEVMHVANSVAYGRELKE